MTLRPTRATLLPRSLAIERLTSKQRAFLRGEAHGLDAILHVGSDGVTGSVIQAVEEAFNTRELLKVRVLEGAPLDARNAADAVRDALPGVHVVQTIGRTFSLYRPFPQGPALELPG